MIFRQPENIFKDLIMQTLTIIQPDDFHLHVRDGDALQSVVPYTAKQMGRALIMPNLKPPITTVAQALAYKQQIQATIPAGCAFEPLMCLYLTDKTTPEMVREAKAAGIVAFKLYPAGATTNSDSGVTNLFNLLPVLEEMAKQGILFLTHGEVTDADVDIFDREAVFIDKIMKPILNQLPNLKVVFEHITTAEAAKLVCESGDNVAATVTPQHLMYNRNHLLVGGVRPHFYCVPIIKRESHRQALIRAVTIELYAQIFEQAGALDKLEAFASQNGARFYGLPENTRKMTLIKQAQKIPESVQFGESEVVPMCAGEEINWSIQSVA